MQSNTTIPIKVYLMAILDNYIFRPLLAIFRLSSRELKVLLYILCAHVVQRSVHRVLLRNVISICGHSGLPSTRPQSRGRKGNTPLHNTSGPEPSNLTLATSTTMPLVTAYHRIQKLHYAIRPYVQISAPRERSMYIVGP